MASYTAWPPRIELVAYSYKRGQRGARAAPRTERGESRQERAESREKREERQKKRGERRDERGEWREGRGEMALALDIGMHELGSTHA
jgi:hypothetical protein